MNYTLHGSLGPFGFDLLFWVLDYTGVWELWLDLWAYRVIPHGVHVLLLLLLLLPMPILPHPAGATHAAPGNDDGDADELATPQHAAYRTRWWRNRKKLVPAILSRHQTTMMRQGKEGLRRRRCRSRFKRFGPQNRSSDVYTQQARA